jgi:hypothetical protein
MLTRLHITFLLGLVVVTWWIILIIKGFSFGKEYLIPFTPTITAFVCYQFVLDKFLWRWKPVNRWMVKRPDLRGTWLVKIESNYINSDTKKKIEPITAFMGIEQTFFTLKMHLMTEESESWLIVDKIENSPKGNGFRVVGVYNNEPEISLRGNRSEIHYGVFILDIHGERGKKPIALEGHYWTDRNTNGKMCLSEPQDHVYTRFKDAQKEFKNAS